MYDELWNSDKAVTAFININISYWPQNILLKQIDNMDAPKYALARPKQNR